MQYDPYSVKNSLIYHTYIDFRSGTYDEVSDNITNSIPSEYKSITSAVYVDTQLLQIYVIKYDGSLDVFVLDQVLSPTLNIESKYYNIRLTPDSKLEFLDTFRKNQASAMFGSDAETYFNRISITPKTDDEKIIKFALQSGKNIVASTAAITKSGGILILNFGQLLLPHFEAFAKIDTLKVYDNEYVYLKYSEPVVNMHIIQTDIPRMIIFNTQTTFYLTNEHDKIVKLFDIHPSMDVNNFGHLDNFNTIGVYHKNYLYLVDDKISIFNLGKDILNVIKINVAQQTAPTAEHYIAQLPDKIIKFQISNNMIEIIESSINEKIIINGVFSGLAKYKNGTIEYHKYKLNVVSDKAVTGYSDGRIVNIKIGK